MCVSSSSFEETVAARSNIQYLLKVSFNSEMTMLCLDFQLFVDLAFVTFMHPHLPTTPEVGRSLQSPVTVGAQ